MATNDTHSQQVIIVQSYDPNSFWKPFCLSFTQMVKTISCPICFVLEASPDSIKSCKLLTSCVRSTPYNITQGLHKL